MQDDVDPLSWLDVVPAVNLKSLMFSDVSGATLSHRASSGFCEGRGPALLGNVGI
jgi:hypothetical protein